MAQLIEAQRTLLRGLLSAVYQAGTGASGRHRRRPGRTAVAWALLATLDREQPEAMEAVLGHPYIRVWAVRAWNS